MQYIPGIDVSHWQAQIDWPAVRSAGKRYAFIKATEGTSFVDLSFERNWREAKKAGLLVGAYHFFRPLQDAKKQAEHFLKTVGREDGNLPPVLDMEVNDRLRAATYIQRVEIWINEVESQTGKKPIIYSGVSFLNSNFTIAAGGPPLWAQNHILWIANYLGPQATKPVMPTGWKNWTFWQHSASGRVNGIQGNVDLNWFNGSLTELFALTDQAPDDEDTPTENTTYLVKSGDTLRSITNKFNITMSALLEANPQMLKSGMQLNIPAGATSVEHEDDNDDIPQEIYFVQAGDSLGRIAARFGTTIDKLVEANGISNPDVIHVGQRLVIP
ncbi:GH25 family lysozyme [Chloroflexota bacterium]